MLGCGGEGREKIRNQYGKTQARVSRRRVSKLGLVPVRFSSHECKIVQEPLWNGSSIMGKDLEFFDISFASNCLAEAAGVLIFL